MTEEKCTHGTFKDEYVHELRAKLACVEKERDLFRSESMANAKYARDLTEKHRTDTQVFMTGRQFGKTTAQEIERLRTMYGKAFMVARELLAPDAYQMFVDEMDKFRTTLHAEKESLPPPSQCPECLARRQLNFYSQCPAHSAKECYHAWGRYSHNRNVCMRCDTIREDSAKDSFTSENHFSGSCPACGQKCHYCAHSGEAQKP